jgi:glycosyltransferase involved in cell wall biosynthesis
VDTSHPGSFPAAGEVVTASILRLVTRLNIGGPSRQAFLLTRALRDEFPTVLAAGRPDPTEGEMLDPEVVVQSVPLTREVCPHVDVAALITVHRLLRSTGAHILHTHMAKAGTIGRLAARSMSERPRTVHTFHGHVLQGYFSPRAQRTFLSIERQLANRTDVLIAVSPEIRDQLLDLGVGSPTKFLVMPVGLDLSSYLAVDGPSGALRSELGINSSTPLVGSVGRLVAVKDHFTLLRAVARLPNAHLAIVGDGHLRNELESEVARRGINHRVHFLGWRYDLPSLYSDIDVVVLTSTNEGTPVAIIEALAARRPVVATDVGGVRHVIHDQRTGLLAPPGDDATIASKLSYLLAHRSWAAELGSAGRLDVSGRFGEGRLVEATRALYRSLTSVSIGRSR